jgi:hypothetical protein
VLDQPRWVSFTITLSLEFDLGSGGTFFWRTSKHCLLEKALNKEKTKLKQEGENRKISNRLHYTMGRRNTTV